MKIKYEKYLLLFYFLVNICEEFVENSMTAAHNFRWRKMPKIPNTKEFNWPKGNQGLSPLHQAIIEIPSIQFSPYFNPLVTINSIYFFYISKQLLINIEYKNTY